eukprot:2542359-Alexandrium_andersonii.AAC.1
MNCMQQPALMGGGNRCPKDLPLWQAYLLPPGPPPLLPCGMPKVQVGRVGQDGSPPVCRRQVESFG